jgi:4,5:9,10-diseco-3-hydroxy-5,9,17-trioxoandrosta-1(10),2-diene-4-oate hydrolase
MLDPLLRFSNQSAGVTGSGNEAIALQDRYILVDDVRTRYRMSGTRGPAILLIHGLGASLEAWIRNLGPLGDKFRVYAPDLVWFGRSDKPARPVTGESFTRFITGFMDALGLERAVLVGNSMGGMVACKTALDFPERVSGLALVSSAGFGRELGWWLRLRTLPVMGRPVRMSRRTARWAASWIAHDPNVITDDLLDLTIELGARPDNSSAYHRVLCSGADWRGLKPLVLREIRDAVHALRVPVLIIWGKQDRVIPVAHAQVAHREIAGSELHIMDPCGHAPMLERPEEFNALIGKFVGERVEHAGEPRSEFNS